LHLSQGGEESGETRAERQLRQLPRRRAKPGRWIPAGVKRGLRKSCWDASTDVRRGSMSETVESTLEAVLERENLKVAWAAVKANAGAGGVDGKGIDESERHLKEHWARIREKLLLGEYRPAAVRAVQIAKPGGGVRRLGIPTVQDRLIQQALHQVLSAAFDSGMSESSWGFRPGRSAHDAVTAARGYVAAGKEWVVDIDLASYFGAPGDRQEVSGASPLR